METLLFNEEIPIPKFRDYGYGCSLKIFNKLFFILELITLDINSLQFRDCFICSSVIYLCLLEQMGFLNSYYIFNILPNDISILFNFYDFNCFFNNFIIKITDFNFNDLIPVIHFSCKFFAMNEDKVPVVIVNEENSKTIEDYLQIQTNNTNLFIAFNKYLS